MYLSHSFIQPNYPYNLDNNFGPLPSTSDESKQPQGLNIKEETGKETANSDTLKQVSRLINNGFLYY